MPSSATLASRLEAGPLPEREVASIISDIFAAVMTVHASGKIDGALSAERVILSTGRAWLEEDKEPIVPFEHRSDPALTRFAFMAPEQIRRSSNLDGRVDTYAMGALAFVALTGKLPFYGLNALALVAAKLEHPPPTLESVVGRHYSPLFELFIATAMATAPERRYPNIRVAAAAWRVACSIAEAE